MAPKLLVVDDDDTIRWAVDELFRQAGWDVVAVDGTAAAMEVLQRERFDYLITDLKMAGGTGMEVVRSARRLQPDIGITVLTGYPDVDSAVEAVNLHVWEYRRKPCRVKELMDGALAYIRSSRGGGGRRLGVDAVAEWLEGGEAVFFRVRARAEEETAAEVAERLQRCCRDCGVPDEAASAIVQFAVDAFADAYGNDVTFAAGVADGFFVAAVQGVAGGEAAEAFGIETGVVERNGERSVYAGVKL